jgi:WhiB family redox-sensing transcriptional regulator
VALTWVRTHEWDISAWRNRSACRDSDPDVFFPIGSTGPALEQIATAQRICTACTVRDECLEFALATNQEAGIWGGTTEEERRALQLTPAPRPAEPQRLRYPHRHWQADAS